MSTQTSTQANKQSRGRGGGTTIVPPPHQSANTKARKHPREHGQQRKHQTPATRKQTRPQQACSSTTRANTKRPRAARGQNSVSAGTRGREGRPARTKRKRPTRARRTTHTTSAQTTRFAYGVRLRPQGRTAREKAAHNSPRQSAWVVVFVGVFADVCRLFWLVGFGGLGVFWGCLACFLVF